MKRNNIKLKDFITNITIFSIFTDSISHNFTFYYRFKLYNVLLSFVLIWLIIESIRKFYKRIRFSLFIDFIKYLFDTRDLFTFFVILIFISSLSNIFFGNVTFSLFGKQLLGILLHLLTFYLLIEYNNRDIKKMFTIYLNIAFFIAAIGLIQEYTYVLYKTLQINFPNCFFNINTIIPFFNYGYFLSTDRWFLDTTTIFGFPILRLTSIALEPFSFCTVMMPAFFVALTSFGKNNFKFLSKKKSIVIIIAFMLTFSLVGYIGLLYAIGFLLFKSRRFILCLILPFFLAILFYNIAMPFKSRVPYVYEFLTGKRDLQHTDQSSFTLFLNSLVVFDDITKIEKLVFGKGLGSHQISYNAYIKKAHITGPPEYTRSKWLLNKKDANSLFLRLLSETGLFGLIMFLIFIKRYYINATKNPTTYLWIINNSILILFIIRLIRQGNYFSEGFFFFLLLYYYSKKSIMEYNSQNSRIS